MFIQPNSMAETSRLLFASLRFCILNPSFQLNVETNLLHLSEAVARSRARPVVILLGNAGRMRSTAATFLVCLHQNEPSVDLDSISFARASRSRSSITGVITLRASLPATNTFGGFTIAAIFTSASHSFAG